MEIQIRTRVTPLGRGVSLVSRFVIVPAVYGLGFCTYEGHPLGRCSGRRVACGIAAAADES
jgi:hypothetical protein